MTEIKEALERIRDITQYFGNDQAYMEIHCAAEQALRAIKKKKMDLLENILVMAGYGCDRNNDGPKEIIALAMKARGIKTFSIDSGGHRVIDGKKSCC